jgi:hypothetical protein
MIEQHAESESPLMKEKSALKNEMVNYLEENQVAFYQSEDDFKDDAGSNASEQDANIFYNQKEISRVMKL